jgi:PAS domain S-box-containing protein
MKTTSRVQYKSSLNRRSKNRLLLDENHYRLLIDGLADYSIYWLDIQGNVSSWSLGACKLKGYTEEEAIGLHFSLFFTQKDRENEVPRKALIEAASKGKYHGQSLQVRKDCSTFWADIRIEPIFGPDGVIIGFAKISHDETERKRAEELLKESEETFRRAMEAASIGMALVDLTGRWMKANNACCNLFGYTEAELLTIDFQTVTHPEDLQADLDYVRKVLAGEIDSYNMEKRYYHKSGRIIWALLSVSLARDSKGKPAYFISQIQDITDQKEMDRVKSEFLSVVSHELRTPLTSISASLSLLDSGVAGDVPAGMQKMVSIALHNSERLSMLINDILDVEAIESGGMRFDILNYDIETLVAQALADNQSYGSKYAVQFITQPLPKPAQIAVDKNRFLQILANLMSNAAKFSTRGENVRVDLECTCTSVRVSVVNNGQGIPEEFKSRIFGKFSQADSSATRQKGGTGLGLNISKQLIEKMNGQIGYASVPDGETTFWIELPLLAA